MEAMIIFPLLVLLLVLPLIAALIITFTLFEALTSKSSNQDLFKQEN